MMRAAIVILGALLACSAFADEAEWKDHIEAGTAAYERGDYRAAAPRLEAALKEAEQFDADDVRLASSLDSLANLYRQQGRYADAGPLYRRALAIREKVLGPEHQQVAATLNNFAELHRIQGRRAEAEPLYQRALAIREQVYGSEHQTVATTVDNLANLYREQGRYAEAEPLLRRALAIREKVFDPEHPTVGTTLNNLAELYSTQGRRAEAEPLYQRALAIREKALGLEHPFVASVLNNLANLYRDQARYAEAEPLFRRALAIRQKALGPEHANVATTLTNLADLYRAQAKYAEAEALYRRALAIREKALGPEHSVVATTLNNLASVYRLQGRYSEAEALSQRALAIREKTLGPEHPAVGTSLNNLADQHRAQGRYAEAEPLYQRALAIREKTLGPEHPDVASTLGNLAELYRAQRRYAEAEPLYQRVLAIREKVLPPEHPDVRSSINNLAGFYRSQNREAEVEALYQHVFVTREKVLGPDHPAVATALNDLAERRRAQGRLTEAEPLYQRVLAIREKALGPAHPDVATSLTNLAALYRAQNRNAEAEPLLRRTIAIRQKPPASEEAVKMDADIEAAIGRSLSGEPIRELQAQARAEPPTTTDKQELSVFYHKRGMANRRLGNYRQAIEDLRLAVANNQPNKLAYGGWGVRSRIQSDLGSALEANSEWFAAIDHFKSMLPEQQQTNLASSHSVHLRLSSAYSVLGQFAEAQAALQEANNILPKLRDLKDWPQWGAGHLQHNAAVNAGFLERQGKHVESERGRREALENAERYFAAMNRQYGRDHQFTRGAMESVAGSKINLAANLATQGKYADAEIYARTGLQGWLALYEFNTTQISGALSAIGWARLQQGDLAAAEKYRRYALAAIQGSGVPPHSTALAARRLGLAELQIMQGRWNEALGVLNERDAGLRSDAAQFKRYGSRAIAWAYALFKNGQLRQAAGMVEPMIAGELKRAVPNQWLVTQRRGVLGMALAASGKTDEALKVYRESIRELLRRDGEDVTDEDMGYWHTFWQRVILESYLELLAKIQAAGSAPADLDLIEESFWVADVARGSSVQEAISATAARVQLPDRQLADLARKEQDALNRIVALNRILSGLADAANSDRTTKVLSELRSQIEQLRRERVTLRAEIRRRYPEYAELIDPKPAGIADVRKALVSGEALVSIYLGESQSYVWTIAAGGKATFRVVPVKREEVENDVRELRKAVDFGEGTVAQLRPFDLGRAHKLYRAFFEPDEALWKDAQILNVIPHGALGELPFSLLVTAPAPQLPAGAQSAYADVPWLMRKAAIAQLPSASAFAALRRTPPAKAQRQPFVGFGDPLFTADTGAAVRRGLVRNLTVQKVADVTEAQLSAMSKSKGPQSDVVLTTRTLSQAFGQLSALPDTADELREIAATLKADPARDLFLNRQATEKNVKQASLDNRRVVAFATHGIAPGELTGLDQPALVLSNPTLTGDTDNDGFLTMEEVLGLKLDADWVVLSACNTGSADGRGSEAVSGLGRAFFYAGARSLLVSNWAVETTSARLLTTELFKRQAENPQLTRAEALRQSMLSLMGKSATGAANFSYAHPVFWAPFSLVGDGGR